ncbi:MAG: serine hydrolase, partial [Chitinophagaceae bacterium]|nr:serine hydrolase [Chitinophagaceae bacterium]
QISMARLDESVKKILFAKYNAGLSNFKNIETKNIDEDLNQYTSILKSQIASEAITLLQDPNSIIDKIKNNKNKKIAYVSIGKSTSTVFGEMLKEELNAEFISLNQSSVVSNNVIFQKLKNYDGVIVGIHNLALYPKDNYGLDKIEIELIKKLNTNKNTVLVNFGNPYVLKSLCDENSAILVCFDEADETQKAASKLLSGNAVFKGKLPVSICNNFKVGDGIASNQTILGEKNITRVIKVDKYPSDVKDVNAANNPIGKSVALTCCVSPNALGASISELDKIDNLIENAITKGAFPGCRILAAKNGQVFYDKAFGYLDYGKKNPVDNNTLYDLASVTKAAATTVAVMKLVEEGKINLDKSLGDYLSFTRGSNKQFLKIKDVLLHQAGLKAWIPFYKETLDSNSYPNKNIYSIKKSSSYPNKVCTNLYMSKYWEDTMWKRILDSEVAPRGNYVYSDLDFIFLQKVVEQVSKTSLDKYVKKEFYDNLNMQNTVFNPKDNLKGKKIAPTEFDSYFRHQEINGYVHDMGAAMFGGVSGHAGLFSTAEDLAKLFQMLNNGGIYEGKRYLKKSTIDLFTAKYSFTSRRALGFDKPEPNKSKSQPTSSNCSLKTFGHTGFTGTCVWADPENDIIFIFLSNRTYPSADNKLIQRMDIREKAQQYVYNAFGISSR